MKFSHLAVLALVHTAAAFQSPLAPGRSLATADVTPMVSLAAKHSDDNEDVPRPPVKGLRKLFSRTKRSMAFLTLASTVALAAPKPAQASAPVMAMPKADVRDPLTDALENHQRRMQVKAQEDLKAMNQKAREIEAAEGPAARAKFEREHKANQEKLAQDRLDNLKKLKYELLDEGICPFTDMEGQRRVFQAEKGIDPANVAGTKFYVEKTYETKSPQKSYAYRKQANREMVKAMVEDMKNRGMDPLDYFEKHKDKIGSILDLPSAQAAALAGKYKENLDLYGQITPPKEGEMSAKEKMQKAGKKAGSVDKAEAKRLKAEAKAKVAAEKAAAKAEVKAAKEAARAEAKAAKEAAKKEKEAAKAAAAAASAGAAAAAAATASALGAAANAGADAAAAVEETITSDQTTAVVEESTSGAIVDADNDAKTPAPTRGIPIIPLAGVGIALGASGYGIKVMKENAAAAEEERQRQFKLLMGGLEEGSTDVLSESVLEDTELEVSDFAFEEEKNGPVEDEPGVEVVAKKKKRRGIKSVFGKKKNDRETDINALVASDAKAPEFAKLLAKILTFGAPGRFPEVISLPGDMPLQEFDNDTACSMLTEAQTDGGLSKEEAAETFANVVNCMLIDIVDLASTSLKEKDNKLTVDAIGIVVDFMNHAASLYNAIAEGVVITPVTYGGDLSKGKLEQMYSAYAASGMTNMMSMDEDFENRVSLLQDVFQINEKKAEGLMMKALQKNMMEMLKSGEGMEGMEEMMKGMGMDGMGGLPGMGLGEGEEPSPEQLKELLTTLKTLKETGAIPPEELEEVKKQFKEAFGSSIDEVIKDADGTGGLDTQDKELLDLMKAVLYD